MRDDQEQKVIYNSIIAAFLRNDPEIALIISKAVESGFSLDFGAEEGWTLLHSRVASNDPKGCALLVSLGANVNIKGKDGRTPFRMACSWGRLDCAKAFIDADCDYNLPDNNGRLPLEGLNNWPELRVELLEASFQKSLRGRRAETNLSAEEYIARHLS